MQGIRCRLAIDDQPLSCAAMTSEARGLDEGSWLISDASNPPTGYRGHSSDGL
jgi:hypothetical protein